MKPNPTPLTTVRIQRLIRAPRERVFAAWTAPEQIAQWLVPRPGRVLSATIDLRPGGAFLYHVAIPGGGEEDIHGVFQEIRPPERLVFTWAHRGNPDPRMDFGETLVTVELAGHAQGTEVRVIHSRLPANDIATQFGGGWETALSQLEELFHEDR